MAARDYLQRFWPYFAIAGMVAILLGASAFILETLPPRTISTALLQKWATIPARLSSGWIATLTGRLIVLIPLAALVYPFFKFLPRMYDWTMRSKITRLYDEMRSIEREMEAEGQVHNADAMIAKT